MKYADINKRYTEIVAEYIGKGYTINSASMSGSQGETSKVDLTNGSEIIRVMVDTFSDWEAGIEGVEIVVGRALDPDVVPHSNSGWATIWKKSAGAKELAGVKEIKAGGKLPWFLKADVKPVVLELKNESVAILPDRILLFQKKKLGYYACGAVAYDDVKFTFGIRPFGDPDGPSITDAEQMGSTWEKVNKDGSPDLRFAGNREIPIMKYGEVRMQSQSGLNVWLMCSRVPPVEALENTYQ